ncbi:MAG: protein kinase domain-containing protein [Longimicrobiales bacterium]
MASEFERLQAALPKRYTLIRELDRGGMSRVYLAREELPDREVAIKVLDEELSARLGRERFVREVEVTSSLQHPHIVPIHAAGEAGATLFYVMPYIEGKSLRDRLDREAYLPIEDALRITRQVADALRYAHDKNIIHCDIKPSNILFSSGHAVVADFGIARALRAAESGGEFTQSGLPIGTADYISPEQAGGDAPVDGRSDTYALACVLYEMLGGQPPFHSRTSQATLARHLTDTMPSLRAVRSSVPQALEQVIAQALAKAPSDRHREVTHFADSLMVANTSDPQSASSLPQQRRPPALVLRIAAALLMVAALGLSIHLWSSPVLAGTPHSASIAVMPFENRTGDPRYDLLGRSLAEAVADRLATVPEVAVIGPYTAAALMKDNLSVPQLLDSLKVEHLLHGHVEEVGGRLLVVVRESDLSGFLSPRTRHWIDPDRFSADQISIANAVTRTFLAEVGLDSRVDPGGSVFGPGRDDYLAGNDALGQRTPEAMQEAVARYRMAISLEPTSAAALAALSSAYALSLYYKYDVGLTGYELAARSLSAADSAIALDPGVANGHSARGYIRALLGIDIPGAEADFARAEELSPNAANGPSWSARILAQKGFVDEAFAEARRARDLDPLQAGRRTALASLGFQLGFYDVAIEEAREAYRLEDQLSLAKAFEGRSLAITDRGNECLTLDYDVYDVVRALCLHAESRNDEAEQLVAEAADLLQSGSFSSGVYLPELVAQDLAAYYGFIGDVPRAIEWVRYAFELSPAAVDTRVLGSALFEPVRNDPRFAAAVDEIRTNAIARVEAARDLILPPL